VYLRWKGLSFYHGRDESAGRKIIERKRGRAFCFSFGILATAFSITGNSSIHVKAWGGSCTGYFGHVK